jgi:hypothetical protein
MNKEQYPSARTSGLVIQEMADETLVYDLDINKAHCLNDTATRIWKLCDGRTSVLDMVSRLERNSASPVPEELVWLAIDQLSENNLLQEQLDGKFGGQSRRDVLKKIGLASVVAIPIVASLVAPQSALALSSCQNCNNGSQCNAQGCPNVCAKPPLVPASCLSSCPAGNTCT